MNNAHPHASPKMFLANTTRTWILDNDQYVQDKNFKVFIRSKSETYGISKIILKNNTGIY